MRTIIDTDALFAMFVEVDSLSQRVTAIAQNVKFNDVSVYILATTLSEFSTLSTLKLGFEQSKRCLREIVKLDFIPLTLHKEDITVATELYLKQTSKENSLFDCFIMVASKRFELDCIFSFDKGYKKNSYLLIEDYLSQQSST